MNTIFIRGLIIRAHHGWYEEERRLGQRFLIDLDCRLAPDRRWRGDKLEETVSYAALCEATTRIMTAAPYRLIETAAEAVADGLLAAFPAIEHLRIRLEKPQAPLAVTLATVGVEIERRRDG